MTAAAIKASFADCALAAKLERMSIPVTECGCWIWMGAIGGKRYGAVRHNSKTVRSNRAAWSAFRGDIPDGLHVLHICDVPLCINPDHLFLGTPLDNAQDREHKNRGNQPIGLKNGRHTKPWRTSRGDHHYTRRIPGLRVGELNPRAKLSEQQVKDIRASSVPHRKLARQLGVSHTTIINIRRGRLWGHI